MTRLLEPRSYNRARSLREFEVCMKALEALRVKFAKLVISYCSVPLGLLESIRY
jgi:hypothetical protein